MTKTQGKDRPNAKAVGLWPLSFIVATLLGFSAMSVDVGFVQLTGGFRHPKDWVMAVFFGLVFVLLGAAGWLCWRIFTKPLLSNCGLPESYLDPAWNGWAWMFAIVCGCGTAFLVWFMLVV